MTKVSFASASLSAALLNQFFQAKAQFFYIVEMNLDPVWYALAIGIWAMWNSINDPLVGIFMDRYPTRFGRRLPWMIMFWVPLVISFALIWNPPIAWQGQVTQLFLWLLVVLILYDTSYTVVILAWAALFPEIFTDAHDRNLVAGLRQVFSLVALVLALVIPPFFVKDGDIASYGVFGWILAAISFVNLGLAFYGSREPKYPEGYFDESYTIREGVQLILSNRTLQAFLVGNMIAYFGYGQVLAMLPFYRKFILNQDETYETEAFGLAILLTMISLAFWVRYTSKKDPKQTYMLSALCFAVAIIPMVFVTDPQLAIIFLGLIGFGLAGLLMVVDLLLSDVVEEDYLQNSVRREGIFFGFNGFFIRLGILLQAIALAVVSRLTGFDEFADTQSELAKFGIVIQFIILPFFAFIFGIFIIWKYYDLSGEKLATQRSQVEEKIREDRI
jgi:GPH family glycoside/pentoside/hexuronide:cation symporter